jgi:hypothetical protein
MIDMGSQIIAFEFIVSYHFNYKIDYVTGMISFQDASFPYRAGHVQFDWNFIETINV